MTNIERKTLTEGTVYDLSDLQYLGWTDGDGTDHSGYSCWDFFAPGGAYLGPDEHGIEPIFAVGVAASGRNRRRGIKPPARGTHPAMPPKPEANGGTRKGAGRPPVPRYCGRCGMLCESHVAARAHENTLDCKVRWIKQRETRRQVIEQLAQEAQS